MTLKLAVAGGLGRMGREIALLSIASPGDFELAAIGAPSGSKEEGKHVGEIMHLDSPAKVESEQALKAALRKGVFDVLVEVTGSGSAAGYMLAAIDARVPFVSGSTGVPEKDLDKVRRTASKAGVAGVWTPNFSVGVNVWWATIAKVAKALPGYDIEITEAHHNQKKDAPSGTALRAAELIQKSSGPAKVVHGRSGLPGPRGREIAIHALRMGDVVGEHTAYFAGNAERLEVTHRAHTRMAFAAGALLAAKWVAAQKGGGLFTMADVLGLADG